MFRKAMILRRSGMAAAMSGESLSRRASASPMMVNCRSTADRSISSPRYCSNCLPLVKRSIRSAATWISRRYFRASSRIEQDLFLLHALPEVGIGEAGRRDQVDGPGEQRLELFAQREVGGRVFPGRAIAQVDQEVEVARRSAARAGAE